MDYKQKYKQLVQFIKDLYPFMSDDCKERTEGMIPEFKESEGEKVKEDLIQWISEFPDTIWRGHYTKDVIAWLEKQSEKTNLYSGISFEYNGHTWGMCARDNGVDILLDKQLFKHLENQGEQKLAWSEEDERMLQKTLSIIRYGLLIPIDKEDDPCFVGSSTISWLKSLKQRMEGK